MFVIEMFARPEGDVELALVGVGAAVGHGEDAPPAVLEVLFDWNFGPGEAEVAEVEVGVEVIPLVGDQQESVESLQ